MGRIVAGKYCLLYELGRGGMGSVWAAEHLALRSQVAVKLIEPQIEPSPSVQGRFEREARALATLRSAHVVQVLDYGVELGVQYLVMELLQGQTLRQRLRAEGPLQAHEVWTVIDHVARAMTLTHAAGFVHRDLKPENVFLVNEGDAFSVKVLDFGITKALAPEAAALTHVGAIMGTCQYMSPEQAAGQAVDQRSDLWTLGVIAFECLVGSTPFQASSVVATLSAICHGPIAVPSSVARVPKGFDAWFARALLRNPGERFQTSRELAAELRPVLEAPREWLGNPPPPAGASESNAPRIDAFVSPPPERRSDVRIPSSIPVGIDGGRDLGNTALIYSASRSGALLATRRSWQPGQAIALNLLLDSALHGVAVAAWVVRVSPRDDSFWKFEVAVRFAERLSEELLARIEAKAKPG